MAAPQRNHQPHLQAGAKSVPITKEFSVRVDDQVHVCFGYPQVLEGLGTDLFSSTRAVRSQETNCPSNAYDLNAQRDRFCSHLQ